MSPKSKDPLFAFGYKLPSFAKFLSVPVQNNPPFFNFALTGGIKCHAAVSPKFKDPLFAFGYKLPSFAKSPSVPVRNNPPISHEKVSKVSSV